MTFWFKYNPRSQSLYLVRAAAVSLFCLLTVQGCSSTTHNQVPAGLQGASPKGGRQSKSEAENAPSSNHLKGQTSPYLIEHASDPVDWYAWGEEAFERAKKENKPIFLSSGFASCHWCHVMQHESFEDPATAKFLNDNFVSIIVDREERPYVDEVYSRAAQVIGGRGGWPLTVFLTPDKKPFFAGTYFPNADKFGLPSFSKVLKSVLDSYHQHRGDVDKIANQLCKDIYDFDGGKRGNVPQTSTLAAASTKLLENVDVQFGGMSGTRKYAMPGVLTFALHMVASNPLATRASAAPAKDYLAYLETTLNHMDDGGMHDHLHGGFFRYTTDREWHVPHFEKMLSSNALIAQIYLQGALLTANEHWKKVGLQTLDFCLQNLQADNGAFYGSMDADSPEGEGAFYKYTPAEIAQVLGPAASKVFSSTYSLNQKGQTAGQPGVLYLSDEPGRLAIAEGLSREQWQDKMDALIVKMRQSEAVKTRQPPRIDKKIIAAWNGLMISALVEGYKTSSDQKYLIAAKKAALFVIKNLSQGKNMHRIWAEDKAQISGCLDDYAYTTRALLDLASIDSEPIWLQTAEGLNDTVVSHFFSHHVGFYYSANNKEQALMRIGCARDDGAISPFAVELDNLLRLNCLTGNDHFKDVVNRTVGLYDGDVQLEPASFGSLLAVIETRAHGQDRLVIKEGSDKDRANVLAQQLWSFYAPHVVSILAGEQQIAALDKSWPSAQSATVSQTPAGTSLAAAAAYYCSGRTNSCDAPVTEAALLKAKLMEKSKLGAL